MVVVAVVVVVVVVAAAVVVVVVVVVVVPHFDIHNTQWVPMQTPQDVHTNYLHRW